MYSNGKPKVAFRFFDAKHPLQNNNNIEHPYKSDITLLKSPKITEKLESSDPCTFYKSIFKKDK